MHDALDAHGRAGKIMLTQHVRVIIILIRQIRQALLQPVGQVAQLNA